MNNTNKKNQIRKDLGILTISLLLLILVYIKDYSWAWFGSTFFWVVGFALILFCVFIFGWLVLRIFQWRKEGLKESYSLWIYLIIIGIMITSIYGMR